LSPGFPGAPGPPGAPYSDTTRCIRCGHDFKAQFNHHKQIYTYWVSLYSNISWVSLYTIEALTCHHNINMIMRIRITNILTSCSTITSGSLGSCWSLKKRRVNMHTNTYTVLYKTKLYLIVMKHVHTLGPLAPRAPAGPGSPFSPYRCVE